MTETVKTTDRQNKALELLQSKVAELLTSDTWAAALKMRAKFHRYSVNNLLLIYFQMPEATHVAGYKKWQELGRQVRKGEAGLAILAPITKAIRDDAGEIERYTVVGFRTAYVWDVSQTEGEELPQPERPEPVADNSREAGALLDRLSRVAEKSGYRVTYVGAADLAGAMGSYVPSEKLIRIRDDVTLGQQAKTLAHELAHALADHQAGVNEDLRDLQELEAETAAFLVADACGLDTTEYSFRYLAGYTGSPEGLDKLLQAGAKATKLADRILAALADVAAAQAEPVAVGA